jgi:hypothetical protein
MCMYARDHASRLTSSHSKNLGRVGGDHRCARVSRFGNDPFPASRPPATCRTCPMPPRKMASPSPSARRASSRTTAGKTPERLGQNDGFGESAARTWVSPAPPPKAAEPEAPKKGSAGFVGFADVFALGTAVGAFVATLVTVLPPTAFSVAMPAPLLPALAIAVAASSAHVLYGVVWVYTKAFKKACKKAPLRFVSKKPVVIFETLVLGNKVCQQLALLAWACEMEGPGVSKLLTMAMEVKGPVFSALSAAVQKSVAAHSTQYAVAAGLMLGGQLLNAAIYRAIGRDGVYYGFKLGRPVPWSTAFPFNAGFRHPQYVGGYATQLGVLLVLASPATLSAGLLYLAAWWGLCYVATSLVEASGDNDGEE